MYKYIKRILDIIISLILLIILFIPMIIISIIIKLDKGPIFYIQLRTGLNGNNFFMYKFRSMDKNNESLNYSEENIITKFGIFIRKTSIDELPQLINVIKGDMSLIGPRPWITKYYENFNDEQKKRVNVLPGITGLAQVNGRNNISIHQKIKYDLNYIDNYGFIQDFKIFIKTIYLLFTTNNKEFNKNEIKNEIEEL